MFLRLIPLYLLVAAGFFAGRRLQASKESIALLLFYLITPVVVFYGAITASLELQYLSLPVFFYILCSSIAISSFHLAGRFFPSPTKNILGFACGNANSGYFAIPAAVSLFGDRAFSIVVLCSFGFVLYENTIGFYLTARGHHSPAESISKVIRLPSVYAFIAGLIANAAGIKLTGVFMDLANSFRGTYSVLGMMLIGIAISELDEFKIDWKFTAFASFLKFIAWPLILLGLLYIDRHFVHLFSEDVSGIVFFMSPLPLAANTVAVATFFNAEPRKAAVAVLASTLLALVAIPAWMSLYQ